MSVEKAAATAFLNVTLGKLAAELEGKYKLWKSVDAGSQSLGNDLKMLASAMDDQLLECRDAPRVTAVARAFGDEMRELTHEIEDCMERFVHRVTCKEGASWASRSVHAVGTIRTRFKFAAKIKKLRTRVEETKKRVFSPPAAAAAAAAASPPEYAQPDDLVGIAEATEELRALLAVEPAQLRVVAVVGFGGSGKTTLAREVYNGVDVEEFRSRAWVDAGMRHRDANGILADIHEQLLRGQRYSAASLAARLQASENRYFIVIDDIRMEHNWNTIRDTFKGNGVILVTTAIQPIATGCINSLQANGRSFGYVYKMRKLGAEDSQEMALLGRRTPELVNGAAELLKICDGLPLALASVANELRCQDEPTGQFCEQLCQRLGDYLEREDCEEPNFARLRRVLMDNYISLSDYTVKTCLLYLGIFPADRPLRRKVIIRRWLAEGYARGAALARDLDAATKNFQAFIDRSIIQPVDPSNNAVAKTCRTHGIMHAFMLHKSRLKNFIMPFGPDLKKVRHLFVHGTPSRTTVKTDLSRVRSLTVLGNASNAISSFREYKLMRVLDLEECTDVENGHLKDICKLWNLRYLSLGQNITELPKEIAQLKLLETLHVSKTDMNVQLPVEVIGLPCLVHLIGKFKLQDEVKTEHLPEACKLETLAGFVADGRQGFLQLMVHMERLNRVKIWCDSDDTGMNNHLHEAIQKYVQDTIHQGDDRSLSIDFRELPQGSRLYALREVCNHSLRSGNGCYLTSLKLKGNSPTLPAFIALFRHLRELCVWTSVTRELVLALSEMPNLLYLKLVGNRMDSFVAQPGRFRSLRRLRLVLEVTTASPTLLTVEDGALPDLVSLQLICNDLVGLAGIQVRRLQKLKEVALHPQVAEGTRRAWEVEAKYHPNRPKVSSITRVNEESTNNPLAPQQEEPAPDQNGVQVQQQRVCEDAMVETAEGNTNNPLAPQPEEPAPDQNGVQVQQQRVREDATVETAEGNTNNLLAPQREESAPGQNGVQVQQQRVREDAMVETAEGNRNNPLSPQPEEPASNQNGVQVQQQCVRDDVTVETAEGNKNNPLAPQPEEPAPDQNDVQVQQERVREDATVETTVGNTNNPLAPQPEEPAPDQNGVQVQQQHVREDAMEETAEGNTNNPWEHKQPSCFTARGTSTDQNGDQVHRGQWDDTCPILPLGHHVSVSPEAKRQGGGGNALPCKRK